MEYLLHPEKDEEQILSDSEVRSGFSPRSCVHSGNRNDEGLALAENDVESLGPHSCTT